MEKQDLKDTEAREVINLLQRRLEQLEIEIDMLKNPHPKDCTCKWCEGYTPDHFAITLKNPLNRGRFMWFDEGKVEHP